MRKVEVSDAEIGRALGGRPTEFSFGTTVIQQSQPTAVPGRVNTLHAFYTRTRDSDGALRGSAPIACLLKLSLTSMTSCRSHRARPADGPHPRVNPTLCAEAARSLAGMRREVWRT
jgi:hypothetical protein